LNGKVVVIRFIIAIVIISFVLYFYSDYIMGLLTARPDFELSANPMSIKLGYEGTYNTTVITVRSINGFNSDVNLDVKPVLGFVGVRFILDLSEIHPPVNGVVSCTLKVEAGGSIAPGKYFTDVTGVANNLTRTVRITVEVSE
jgi:hypothetical protein